MTNEQIIEMLETVTEYKNFSFQDSYKVWNQLEYILLAESAVSFKDIKVVVDHDSISVWEKQHGEELYLEQIHFENL